MPTETTRPTRHPSRRTLLASILLLLGSGLLTGCQAVLFRSLNGTTGKTDVVVQRDVVYVEWNRTDGKHNDDFVEDLVAAGVTPGDRPVVFLCRSGNRSIGAAEAATEAGIAPSYNVLDGFEGNLDENKHRGGTGWKAVGLPWKQS